MSDTGSVFCDAFIDAVYGVAPVDPTLAAVVTQPGFAVYRNTILKACVDALAANYPAVQRLTGETWFRAAALEYAHGSAPTSVSLLAYGEDFPMYLERTEDVHKLPYLAGVARIEHMWMQSHTAADQQALDQAALARLSPACLGDIVLAPHASARWIWCETMPVVSIWLANRVPDASMSQLDWRGEGVLLTRQHGVVGWLDIGPGAAAFLDACANASTLQEAATSAGEAEPGLDLASMLAALIGAGAFRAVHLID